MDYTVWLANVRRFFDVIPDSKLTIMCAFNALSVQRLSRRCTPT